MRNKEIGKVEVALQSVEVQVLSLETASPSSSLRGPRGGSLSGGLTALQFSNLVDEARHVEECFQPLCSNQLRVLNTDYTDLNRLLLEPAKPPAQ